MSLAIDTTTVPATKVGADGVPKKIWLVARSIVKSVNATPLTVIVTVSFARRSLCSLTFDTGVGKTNVSVAFHGDFTSVKVVGPAAVTTLSGTRTFVSR